MGLGLYKQRVHPDVGVITNLLIMIFFIMMAKIKTPESVMTPTYG